MALATRSMNSGKDCVHNAKDTYPKYLRSNHFILPYNEGMSNLSIIFLGQTPHTIESLPRNSTIILLNISVLILQSLSSNQRVFKQTCIGLSLIRGERKDQMQVRGSFT